jgi:HSP20 family protein
MALPSILRTQAIPFRHFDTTFDNLFNDFFNSVSKSSFTKADRSSYPRVDVREDRESVTIDATVPGSKNEDVRSYYEDGYLKISAEDQDDVEGDFMHREIHRSAFSRWFSVDEETYQVDKIDASLNEGILSVTIPKRPEAVKASPREIVVN